ncbi:DUF2269 family protein [Caballeronia telluris]|jgi:uncharacterized membrane protein|uniref:Integral membrane protein-like protein n=1 Tax=Caballeronia telluris TaxID=326475 RepID=A0A158ES37_9BURK|nr:DUF2269 domain-containing protein [Caballeronia telluris]SAL09889.1 integral membrane protein-like protein [Caballeronia telluris]
MNAYLVLKCIHILSSTVLFGTGIGIAFFKWVTDRSGDVRAIRIVTERTVLADWMFTTPAVILQPLTGLGLVYPAGYPMFSGWIFYAICLYLLAACCWLPVVWLQVRMRDMARIADTEHTALPRQYWRYARVWFWLGVPAFIALVGVYWLMVFKPTP